MLLSSFRMLRLARTQASRSRFLSTDAPSSVTTTGVKSRAGGASIFQRLASFTIGAGLMALITQYYIFEELRLGNQIMLTKQKELENRLAMLEKK